MIGRESNCKFSYILVLIQAVVLLYYIEIIKIIKKQVLAQADVLLAIEPPGEEINVTKVIHRPGNHTTT